MNKPTIVWNKAAVNQFERAIEYIRENSAQNALKVKANILFLIDLLIEHPKKHPPDRDKINNFNSEFRAFEKHRLRISYYVSNNKIIIIRVRHTKQNPKSY